MSVTSIKIQINQTMFDVAIMATGTVESLFAILAANGKGITDIPHVNDVYSVPAGVQTDENVLQALSDEGYGLNPGQKVLATGDDPTLYIGIGYWQIQNDFKVS